MKETNQAKDPNRGAILGEELGIAKKEIRKGSIVFYDPAPGNEKHKGNYRVSALHKETANLTGVWGGKVVHKKVPLNLLTEDEEAWYEAWYHSFL